MRRLSVIAAIVIVGSLAGGTVANAFDCYNGGYVNYGRYGYNVPTYGHGYSGYATGYGGNVHHGAHRAPVSYGHNYYGYGGQAYSGHHGGYRAHGAARSHHGHGW